MSVILLTTLISAAISLECSSLPTQTTRIDIWSDLDDWVVGNLYPNGAYAVASQYDYTRNTRPYGLKIWESALPYDRRNDIICYIGKSFYVPGIPVSATLDIVADDKSSVMINNKNTGCSTSAYNDFKLCNVGTYIVSGLNTINITVTNVGRPNDPNEGYLNYWLKVISSVQMVEMI